MRKMTRVLPVVLVFLMLFAFVPTVTYGATAQTIWVGNQLLSSSNKYLVGNTSSPTGTLDGSSCTAKFEPSSGTLTLYNYNGGSIQTATPTKGDIKIILMGNNTITQFEHDPLITYGNVCGISNVSGDNIIITSDTGGTLDINVSTGLTSTFYAFGITTGLAVDGAKGNVTFDGNANVTINAKVEATDSSPAQRASGIDVVGNVYILDEASLSAKVTSTGYFDDEAKCITNSNGNNNITINTEGNVMLDSSGNPSSCYAFSTDNFYLNKVSSLTLKWTGNNRASSSPAESAWTWQKNYFTTTKNTNHDVYTYTPPDIYNITFNGNGGSGVMSDVLAVEGEASRLPISTFSPPYNKVFKAWEINGNEYIAGDSYTFTENTTVNAVWRDLFTYTLSYDSNGGSSTMSNDIVTENKPFTLPNCSFTPPTGKVFRAWEINGSEYNAGESCLFTEDTIIKAIWDNDTYTVKYNNNGGGGTMFDSIAVNGTPFLLPECTFSPPLGKVFSRWSINGTEYAPGSTYMFTEDTEVVAVWKDVLATGITLNKSSLVLNSNKSAALIANIFPSNSLNKSIAWTSSNNAIASVVNGKVVAKNTEGSATITATTVNEKKAYCSVVVVQNVTKIRTPMKKYNISRKKSITIPVICDSDKLLVKSKLSAKSNKTNLVTVKVSGNNIKLKTNKKKTGTARITVKSANGKSVVLVVKVVKKATKIKKVKISGLKNKYKVGQIAQIKANPSNSNATNLKVTYRFSKNKIATVDKAGKVMFKKKGKVTITVKVGNKSIRKKISVK